MIKKIFLWIITPKRLRLKPNTDLNEDTIRKIAKEDFDEIWAILKQSQESWDKAIADFNQAIAIAPKDSLIYFYIANVYLGKKQYDKAWVNMNKARENGLDVVPEILEAIKKKLG